jgi:hypothetical protein
MKLNIICFMKEQPIQAFMSVTSDHSFPNLDSPQGLGLTNCDFANHGVFQECNPQLARDCGIKKTTHQNKL